jgi:DNA-binding MarR family transcriptional regulator
VGDEPICLAVLYSVAIQISTPPADTDTDALAAALERRVARLTQLLRANAHASRSVASLLTLRRLDERGPMRITELAAAELVAQPTMTGLVQRLEHDGLVARSPDPADARAVRVALTDAGRATLAAVRQDRARVLHQRIERLDDGARAALAAALPALDELLEDPA